SCSPAFGVPCFSASSSGVGIPSPKTISSDSALLKEEAPNSEDARGVVGAFVGEAGITLLGLAAGFCGIGCDPIVAPTCPVCTTFTGSPAILTSCSFGAEGCAGAAVGEDGGVSIDSNNGNSTSFISPAPVKVEIDLVH